MEVVGRVRVGKLDLSVKGRMWRSRRRLKVLGQNRRYDLVVSKLSLGKVVIRRQ